MLNSVRYSGFFDFIRNVHWLHALVTATSIVSWGPSNSSDAKSTAYDTDIVEPLLASGRLTLNAEVIAEVRRRTMKSVTLLKSERGPSHTTSVAPTAIVAPTYNRAASGKARICAGCLRPPHRLGANVRIGFRPIRAATGLPRALGGAKFQAEGV